MHRGSSYLCTNASSGIVYMGLTRLAEDSRLKLGLVEAYANLTGCISLGSSGTDSLIDDLLPITSLISNS